MDFIGVYCWWVWSPLSQALAEQFAALAALRPVAAFARLAEALTARAALLERAARELLAAAALLAVAVDTVLADSLAAVLAALQALDIAKNT